MGYDPATRQLVLFGGAGCAGSCGDTWVWDGRAWMAQPKATGPVGRDGAMMAYDLRTGQLLMFGGEGALCNGQCTDTWAWHGSSWSALNTAGPTLRGGAMAYDRGLGTVVLYGAAHAGDTQTWEWTGKGWIEASATGPCNTSYAAMAGDDRASVVLFGGYGSCAFQDTTETWDGNDWIDHPEAPSPAARSFATMAFDPLTAQTILFGGEGSSSPGAPLLNDTWALH